jgi:cell division protease FtsH
MTDGVAVNGDRTHQADGRTPITDVKAWFESDPRLTRDALPVLRALGELLIGTADEKNLNKPVEDEERFISRCLGDSGTIVEARRLSGVSGLTFALALAEWIEQHQDKCETGPGQYRDPPTWTETEIGDQRYRHPQILSAHFPVGTLDADDGCVVQFALRSDMRAVHIHVTRDNQDLARSVMDRLAERANQLNPYRGRAARANGDCNSGLALRVIDLPPVTRDDVIVSEHVWTEIDLGLKAVRDRYDWLNEHGLGARRGVLLCGPPGTGKSAVSAAVAREVVGKFTVIYVEAKAGAELLTEVVEEAQRLGGPVLLILEDVDLWCHDRGSRSGSGSLSELLQAMDIEPSARILTLASTNDVATLDKAAIRTGRFDSIVEVGYPDRAAAAKILTALLRDLPGGQTVDTDAVAAKLPEKTTGSDIREIVRRAVLAGDDITTATLLAEVRSGRYRADAPEGMYL